MLLVYNIGTRLYYLIIRIAALFSHKAKQAIAGRNGLLEHIKEDFQHSAFKTIWFHCASLGEYEQARPLIEKIKKLQPEYTIVLTFFSPSGYEVRKQNSVADFTYYLPFDTAQNAKTFIDTINPKYAFFIKYDLWHHYLSILKKYQIEHYLISAHFHPKQIYFQFYGTFFKNMLLQFQQIYCQYESSIALLKQHHINKATLSGDTRFDRVLAFTEKVTELPEIASFCNNQFTLILGSSYATEEGILFETLRNVSFPMKVIVAPHEIGQERITEIENLLSPYGTVRYSTLKQTSINTIDKQILIIDNVGILAAVYQYSQVSFVGGGFGNKGLHNTLEPLSMGNFVVFGPNNHDRFPEAQLIIEAKLGAVVVDATSLEAVLNHYHQNENRVTKMNTRIFIKQHAGSTDKIYHSIFG